MGALLHVEGVVSGYGPIRVLDGVHITVPEGAVVVLLGANGAGKTTTLRTIAGLLPLSRGRITLDGRRIDGLRHDEVARRGVVLVPEGRGVFPSLSVRENLEIAARAAPVGSRERAAAVDEILDGFPRLRERLAQLAGTLSGGEQQMLALSRGLLTQPRLLMIDELSLGLAPRIIEHLFATVAKLKAQHQTMLLVEQYVEQARAVADLCYVLDRGRVAFVGDRGEMGRADLISDLYLGAGSVRT